MCQGTMLLFVSVSSGKEYSGRNTVCPNRQSQSSSCSIWVLQLRQSSLASGSQSGIQTPHHCTLLGSLHDPTYLHNNTQISGKMQLTLQSKATMDKTASVLAPIKALATSNLCIGHLHTLLIKM